MIDFEELSRNGLELELMTRELLFSLGYQVRWSGSGVDGGRDLTVLEPGDKNFGDQTRTWLVSCKDFAESGRAVGIGDVDEIVVACQAHGAEGFLLVCTTHPSAQLVERLEQTEARQQIRTHYWDGASLRRLLSRPASWAVAQRFMPISTAGWQVWATEAPNYFLGSYRGHYLHLVNRHASGTQLTVEIAAERIDIAERITEELPEHHHIRARGIWWDDKHGFEITYLDYIKPRGDDLAIEQEQILALFGDEGVDGHGQACVVDLEVVETNPYNDGYDMDHYLFYTAVARMVRSGARRNDPPWRL